MTPPRSSMTLQMQAWVKKKPWLMVLALVGRSLLGAAVMGFGFWRIHQHPAGIEDTKLHMAFDGGIVALGLLILPGVVPAIVANATPLLGLWRSFKGAKESKTEGESGGAGPKSGGN